MTLHKMMNQLGRGMSLSNTYLNYMRVLSKEEVEGIKKIHEKREKEMIKKLAELEHEQWCFWSKDIASTGLNDLRLERWKKLWIPYNELPEEMKREDRLWAERVLKVFRRERNERI